VKTRCIRVRHVAGIPRGMAGVRSFEEMDAYKLAVALRDLVYTLLETGRALQDQNFCEQIRTSVSSQPANLSEGWGRFKPRDHARCARIAKASLDETKSHLLHGRTCRYFTERDFTKAFQLNRRALGATVRLIQYLDSCKGRLPWEAPPQQQ